MKSSMLRLSALMGTVLFAFVLIFTACPGTGPVDEPGSDGVVVTDGDTTDTAKPDDTQTPDTPIVKDDTKGPEDPAKPEADGGTTPDVCPPGCGTCGGGTGPTDKLDVGAACTKPEAGQPNPCKDGLLCFEVRVVNGRFYRPVTQCVKSCNTDADCGTPGISCVSAPNGADPAVKICSETKTENEACDASLAQLCASTQQVQLDCLVKDINNDTVGACTRRCQADINCDVNSGRICRKPVPDAVSTYCLEPSLPGPKCLGETCDVSSNATNCLSGLACDSGICVKECTVATQDKDCDTAAGETCFQAFGSPKGFCQPKPTVTTEGEACNPLKRCDESKGLACVTSGDSSTCVRKCDTNKGEDNNPDCPADTLCQKPSDQIPFGICRKKAGFSEPCGITGTCTATPSACINVNDTLGALCLRLCDPDKNDDKDLNPDCDGGKGSCVTLNSAITSGGKSYMGACFAGRPKTQEVGESCDFNKNDGLKSPDCKDGGRCIFFSGTPGPQCYLDCDPCKSFEKNGDWYNNVCANGDDRCLGVTSGGQPAGGVCEPAAGKPVRDVGQPCDSTNGCKDPDNVTCVRFSNAEDATSICSKNCDPGKGTQTNPECPGNASCLGLNNGGGVCNPLVERTQKIGEGCNGPRGTPRYNECLAEQDGKKLFCAEPGITGIDGTCQVFCNPTKGFKDNADCKAAGLSNHLCLPGDLTQPDKGGCLEICSFSSRKDCSQKQCQFGQCREFLLGKSGDCDTQAKETDCQSKGGTCVNKTCLSTVCL